MFPAIRHARARFLMLIGLCAPLLAPGLAQAHNVAAADRAFLKSSSGAQPFIYAYLGAKHMVTGYDHLLFLLGVIFFLYRLRDVAGYVTLFAIGHSTTLLLGVLAGWHVNAYAIDAIIGLSVAYKAFENLGGFRQVFGIEPDTRVAVLVFGLFHGMGLATRIQELALSRQSLLPNLVSFNVGVEIGQLLALGVLVLLINLWRTREGFARHAFAANVVLMGCGFVLVGYQLSGYFLVSAA
ncbi:MAG: HupE/UreJ family protein [Steroidobacteraceae bacterium]